MNAGLYFRTSCLLLSGVAFAAITLVVAVRGVQDLRELFQHLRERKDLAE